MINTVPRCTAAAAVATPINPEKTMARVIAAIANVPPGTAAGARLYECAYRDDLRALRSDSADVYRAPATTSTK